MYKILIVDDEQNVLKAISRALKSSNYDIHICSIPHDALELIKQHKFDLILSDFKMPGMDGATFLGKAKNICPDAIRIILSGAPDLDAMIRSINEAEIYRFICKPWHDFDLRSAVEIALRHNDLLRENERLANEVKSQNVELERQRKYLSQLEFMEPGITKVNWAEDGSIILDNDMLDDFNLEDSFKN